MTLKYFVLGLNRFKKVEILAKIDQNGKGLALTFCTILTHFWTFQKRLKKAETILGMR